MNNKAQKIIAVFGSASIDPTTPEYKEAVDLGKQLAAADYAVMTGGYGGLMGAISEGAATANGHVIGVTVGMFRERGLKPNRFLHEEVHLPTLAERLNYLIVKPDAYVMLKGGVGTLSELALAWSLVQVGEVAARPLVLLGPMWREFVPHFASISMITANDVKRLTLVDSLDQVVPALAAWWASPPDIPLRLGDVQKTPPLGNE